MPVLNVMNREFGTFVDLQKTLSQIGISSGSILLRLSYRQTETPLEVATAEIGQYFKEVEEAAQSTEATPSTETSTPAEDGTITDQITKVQESGIQSPSSQTSSSVSGPAKPAETPVSDEGIAGPGERMISVFSAPTSAVPRAAQQEFNDSDYEPSVADAKLHQSRLLNRTQNKRLLSDAEQEALQREREAKKSLVVETRVKVRFPDQTTVQFPVNAAETGAAMLEFVRSLIVAGDQPFSLIYKDSKGQIHNVPDSSTVRLIKDLGFEGPTLVTFTWKDEASEDARKWPILQQKYATQAKPVQVPEIPKAQGGGGGAAPKPKEEKKAGSGKSTEDKLKGFLKGLSKK
jgi:tether containing UBX domain for GLUT4